MNKTINIHLAQTLFALDEKAYRILKQYLENLETLFENTEGAKDILEDIEVRISELFSEIKKDETYVFSVEDVQHVIEVLGQPEDFIDEDEPIQVKTPIYNKMLFRDPDDRFIGGVAGGLSHYIGLESVWVRLILLVLFFSSVGSVVLVYILLWILVPEAKTTADKLKMKGEPINVSTIKKKIKEELDQMGETVKDMDYESLGNKIKNKSKSLSDLLLNSFRGLTKILTLFLGMLFLFISSLSLLGLIIGSLVGGLFTTVLIPDEVFHFWYFTDVPIQIIGLIVVLIIGIPFVFIFSLGLQLLSQNRQIMGRTTRFILLSLWLFALIVFIGLGIYETQSFAVTAKKNTLHQWEHKTTDTLKLYLNNNHHYTDRITLFDNVTLVEDEKGNSLRLNEDIRLTIEKNKDPLISLAVVKTARGWNQSSAKKIAEDINYTHDFYDEKLMLDNFWTAPAQHKNKPQKIRLTLKIPDGKYLYIEEEFNRLLAANIDNDQNYYRKRIAGHLWKMDQGKLMCQDCNSTEGNISFDEDEFKLNVEDDDTVFEVNIGEDGLHIRKKKDDN